MAVLVAVAGLAALAGGAQANVTLPGLNGKIAFASDRDAVAPLPDVIKGFDGGDCEGAPEGDDECGFDIFTMNPDGTAIVNLTQNQAGENNSKDDKPSWSPDGTQIAFEGRRDCRGDDGEEEGPCEADIFVMNADGSNVRQLTDGPESDTHPTWSPDGNTIAFERGDLLTDGFDRIATVPAAGGGITNFDVTGLGDSEVADLLPAWSPDGTKLAVTRISGIAGKSVADVSDAVRSGNLTGVRGVEGFTIHTYIVTLATGDAQAVGDPQTCFLDNLFGAVGCQFDLNPAFPPSGARIAFHRLRLTGLGIDGEENLELRTDVVGFADDVDIIDSSLDGSSQTTLAEEEGACTSATEVTSLATRGPVPVPCVDDFKPAYSPDNTRVAFHSDRGNPACLFDQQGPTGGLLGSQSDCRPQLYLMNSDGSGVSGPIAPATIRGEPRGDQATDRNADWQRILPPPVVTPTTPPAARRDTRRPRVRVAALRGCSASTRLRVPVRINERGGIRRVTVLLDGKRLLSTRRRRFTLTINARRLRPGRHRLRIVAIDRAGNRTSVRRTIVRCAQRPRPAPHFTG